MIRKLISSFERSGLPVAQAALLIISLLALWTLLVPDQSRVQETYRLAMISLRPSLEYTLVSGDTRYLMESASELLETSPIQGIEVRDEHGIRIEQKQKTGVWSSPVMMDSVLYVNGKPVHLRVFINRWAMTTFMDLYAWLIELIAIPALLLSMFLNRMQRKKWKNGLEQITKIASSNELPENIPPVRQELASIRDVLFDLHGRMHALKEKSVQDRDKALAELYDRIDELSKVNLELTREREKAEESNREKSVFLANISHELRTPLNAIIGVSDHLSREYPGNHEIELIQSSSRHLLSLIDQILLANCATASDPKPQPHDLNMLFRSVMDVLEQDAYTRNLWLVYDPDPRVQGLTTDEMRFRQIVTNLLSNAIKYTLKGGVILQTELDKDTFIVHIIDTGPGIDQKDLVRLFQPFSRRENELREGFGLGLYIAHSLCDSLGYELKYASNPSGGSIFSIIIPAEHCSIFPEYSIKRIWGRFRSVACDTRYRIFHLPHDIPVLPLSDLDAISSDSFPVAVLIEHPDSLHHSWPELFMRDDVHIYTPFMREATELMDRAYGAGVEHVTQAFFIEKAGNGDQPVNREEGILPPVPSGSTWSGLRCLAADDNPTNLEVLRLLLDEEGLDMVTTEQGDDLISFVTEHAPDIAFIDGHMPNMNPTEVAQEIRTHSPLSRIVFISADVYLDQTLPDHLHDGFLPKPVTTDTLRVIMQNNLAACFEPGNISNITTYHGKTVRRIYQLSQEELTRIMKILESPDQLSSDAFAEIAHRLNGTGRYCGGTRLIELCLEIEEIFHRDGELSELAIRTSCVILSREIQRLLARIGREIDQLNQYEGEVEPA